MEKILEYYYELLGVSRDASIKEIKKAFSNLSLKYHPDRIPCDKKAHELYLKINHAHEVLTTPELKEIYDIYGEEGLNQKENNNNNVSRTMPSQQSNKSTQTPPP